MLFLPFMSLRTYLFIGIAVYSTTWVLRVFQYKRLPHMGEFNFFDYLKGFVFSLVAWPIAVIYVIWTLFSET